MLDGGQANVDKGKSLGIVHPLFIKGWAKIASNPGLFDGSKFNILVIKFLALSDIMTWSGKE